MGVGGALRDLGRFLDGFEAAGEVRGVELVGDIDLGGAGALTAEVEVQVSPCPLGADQAVGLAGSSVTDDGRLRLELESAAPIVPTSDRVAVEVADAVVDDGGVLLTLAVAIPTDRTVTGGGEPAADDAAREPTTDTETLERSTLSADSETPEPSTAHGASEPSTDRETPAPTSDTVASDRTGDTAAHDGEPRGTDPAGTAPIEAADDDGGSAIGWRDRDVPPFRDQELLQEVYDSCDTFAEMPEALGMDVTAETVRRYMIDYGIHEPSTYNTAGDDGAETADDEEEADEVEEPGPPVAIADGIGLPDDVTVDTIIETVRQSNTIYEVQRDIGIPREDALEMLRDLNLLDLVVGRLATEAEREISRDEVVDRLRQRADVQ